MAMERYEVHGVKDRTFYEPSHRRWTLNALARVWELSAKLGSWGGCSSGSRLCMTLVMDCVTQSEMGPMASASHLTALFEPEVGQLMGSEEEAAPHSNKTSVIRMRSRGGSCPACQAPLRQLSINDIVVGEEAAWTRRFADVGSGLAPGRYRCEECSSEWWQFPVAAAG